RFQCTVSCTTCITIDEPIILTERCWPRRPPARFQRPPGAAASDARASLSAPDIQRPTARARTVEGDIRAGEVLVIRAVTGDRHRQRTRRLRRRQYQGSRGLGDTPREGAPAVVPGIGERCLPCPGQLGRGLCDR